MPSSEIERLRLCHRRDVDFHSVHRRQQLIQQPLPELCWWLWRGRPDFDRLGRVHGLLLWRAGHDGLLVRQERLGEVLQHMAMVPVVVLRWHVFL